MSGIVDSITKTVGDIGNVAGDVLSGNIGKVGSDLGKTVQDGLPLAIDAGVAMFAPEALGAMGGLGDLGDITGLLGGLGQAGGGFDLGALGGMPGMVSPGNWLPQIMGAFSGSGSTGGLGGIAGGLTGILGGSTGFPNVGGMPSFGGGATNPTQGGLNSMQAQQQQLMNWVNGKNLAIEEMQMIENLIQKMIDNIGSLGR